ncbi:MAG: substrate-binding domain-containing protein [Nitrospirota bacterium]
MRGANIVLTLLCLITSLLLAAVVLAGGYIYPPWEASPEGGVEFTVPGIDNIPDLYGDIINPDLVVFFGGNEFMVMPEIIQAFQKAFPQYRKIFYETLPPGIIEEQVRKGSLVIGNLLIALRPDVFTGGKEKIKELETEGWFDETVSYAGNRLALMVRRGNPKKIRTIGDLGRDDVNVSMPNPEIEDIAKKITALTFLPAAVMLP